MKYSEFKKALIKEFEKKGFTVIPIALSEKAIKYDGAYLVPKGETVKENGKLVLAVFYIRDMYNLYKNFSEFNFNDATEEIIRRTMIKNEYSNKIPVSVKLEKVVKRENILPVITSKVGKSEFLDKILYREIEGTDLVLYFMSIFADTERCRGKMFFIKDCFDDLTHLGVTNIEELEKVAWENFERDYAFKVVSSPAKDMWIVATTKGEFSATYIANPHSLDEICSIVGAEELVISLVSTNEMVVMDRNKAKDVKFLYDKICFVNSHCGNKELVVSDNLYFYKDGKLSAYRNI